MSATAIVPQTEPDPVVAWTRELNGARMLMKSGLLPVSVKSPEAALYIILAGRDLGLSPVQSLRSINVIQGKVEVAADMQLGLFHRAGGKSQWVKLTNEEAVLRLAAPWLIEPHIETFGLEDAKRAGLNGDNWRKYPKAMCRSRAITAGLKSVGFDPTAGVYDYGEIGGPEPIPFLEEPAEAKEEKNGNDNGQAKAESRKVTPAERQELLNGARLAGINTAEEWREFIVATLGRDLRSEKDIIWPDDVALLTEELRKRNEPAEFTVVQKR